MILIFGRLKRAGVSLISNENALFWGKSPNTIIYRKGISVHCLLLPCGTLVNNLRMAVLERQLGILGASSQPTASKPALVHRENEAICRILFRKRHRRSLTKCLLRRGPRIKADLSGQACRQLPSQTNPNYKRPDRSSSSSFCSFPFFENTLAKKKQRYFQLSVHEIID